MSEIENNLVATDATDVRTEVSRRYGKVAEATSDAAAKEEACCGPGCCGGQMSGSDLISSKLGYSEEELKAVPDNANLGLGCGNPQAIANLKQGETVLDLGSGAGFDAFLAAQAVGESGKVYGVDMTPSMIELARKNAARQQGGASVEFRLGEIEALPVSDSTVDVIISNCVINLSPEKPKVYAEAFRVLKSGGRLAISDVVAFRELPEDIRNDMAAYAGCVAGASRIEELESQLAEAGFTQISVEPLLEKSKEFIEDWAPERGWQHYVASANIQAVKP